MEAFCFVAFEGRRLRRRRFVLRHRRRRAACWRITMAPGVKSNASSTNISLARANGWASGRPFFWHLFKWFFFLERNIDDVCNNFPDFAWSSWAAHARTWKNHDEHCRKPDIFRLTWGTGSRLSLSANLSFKMRQKMKNSAYCGVAI